MAALVPLHVRPVIAARNSFSHSRSRQRWKIRLSSRQALWYWQINSLQGHQKRGSVNYVPPSFLLSVNLRTNLLMGPVLDGLGADDILIVSELSRIGRSMLDCMEILAIAAKQEIRVYAIKGNWHLDETIQSKIMAMVFSMAAEIERGLISARTKEALRARRASGLPVGRPKGPGKSKLDKHRPEIEALLANGSTRKFIAKRYNSSPANLANWLKKRGIKKPKL